MKIGGFDLKTILNKTLKVSVFAPCSFEWFCIDMTL